MLRSFDKDVGRDIAFIPVGINYDRVFEDRSFQVELDPSARRPGTTESFATATQFAVRNALLMARNRWHRFGYACVNFGSPVSLVEYLAREGVDLRRLPKDERFPKVEAFARTLMEEIAKVIPVTPVALAATVLVRQPDKSWSRLELKAEILRLLKELDARGAHVYIPRRDLDYAFEVGLRMLLLRRLVVESAGMLAPVREELPLLNYYANSIAHFATERAAG
jgi:glycerol-3-phosphate O-acyltransferase